MKDMVFVSEITDLVQDAALDIDHSCHNIHNNTADIQLHGGIERQRTGTETRVWEKRSDRNVQETQSKTGENLIVTDDHDIVETRARSEKLRAEVEHHLATAATAMLDSWNTTNQVRIDNSNIKNMIIITELHCQDWGVFRGPQQTAGSFLTKLARNVRPQQAYCKHQISYKSQASSNKSCSNKTGTSLSPSKWRGNQRHAADKVTIALAGENLIIFPG